MILKYILSNIEINNITMCINNYIYIYIYIYIFLIVS